MHRAGVIDALSQEVVGQDTAVTYFYCDYADHNTLEASAILGTIIQQLLAAKTNIEEVIAVKIRDTFNHGISKPLLGDLFKILECIILEYHRRVYIFIDGLDEASLETQENVLSNLAKLTTTRGTLLRLCISARKFNLRSAHFSSCLSLDVSGNHVKEDMEHYIKGSVQQRLHSLPVMLTHSYLEQSAVSELTAKAHGL